MLRSLQLGRRKEYTVGVKRLSLIVPLVALAGCVTVAPETELLPPASSAPEWRALRPGVELAEIELGGPPLALYAARVDTAAPDVTIAVCSTPSPVAEATAKLTTSFVRDSGAVVAINATPFDPAGDDERIEAGNPVEIVGTSISGGRVVSTEEPRLSSFVVFADGSMGIRSGWTLSPGGPGESSPHRYAAGGFFHVLRDGLLIGERDFRAPRSAVGIAPDGEIAILMVADGRQLRHSVGLTAYEVGAWLRYFGAANGLLLDGGGSSALALRGERGVKLLNRPVATVIPGVELAVANHIAVFLGAPSAACR